MSDGIQITIPDFDDDDSRPAQTPFGRSAFGFGGGGSSSGFGGGLGLDSPSGTTTPVNAFHSADRSYFSHSRGDSSASIDSTGSATTRFATKPSTPFSHSAHPSFAASGSSTPFSKKPSFASIRNAFKSSGKNSEAPPMPSLNDSPYPVLKNPFGNRSTSSLNHIGPKGPNSAGSFQRPPTPSDTKFGRAVLSKSKGHGYTRSQHSHSGSIFHTSDGGSDYGNNSMLPSPPPVPRVPSAYGNMYREDTAAPQDLEEDKVVMDLKTPSDYALHAVFIRFATSAEEKIDTFLRQPLDQDSLLTTFMGPRVDSKLDDTLQSLGIIAQKHAKQVIDSIMRWRRTQIENVGPDLIRLHMSNRVLRANDVPSLLNERKSLASIYIMCRALIAVLQLLSTDALGDTLGFSLLETTFEQFKKPDRKMHSPNHRLNSELYAALLGHLANVRFMEVVDRFVDALKPLTMGQKLKDQKDEQSKYENIVKGLRHIKIKVWPPEAFEEATELMESLSVFYANSHGPNLKISFAETLITLLHPIGKTAQAETNHPTWGKSMEPIFNKAKEMMGKPRYWQVAFPLAITSLCVSPQAFFIKNWQSLAETAVSKLKEKPYRAIVMNGLLRLVWTYLYRCQESASTTRTKLETLLKNFFPPSRTAVLPSDDQLETLTYIIHFILSRHPEFGRELCLELLQESAISSLQAKGGNVGTLMAPERTSVVINAILLSVHLTEREILTPSWPTSTDFTITPSRDDYPISSTYVPAAVLKPGLQEFLSRTGAALTAMAVYCGNAAGYMSVFDDQYSYARLNPSYEETSNYVVRRHPDNIVIAYPAQSSPHILVLNTLFQSWPRFHHPSIALTDAVDLLLRGVIHVEPAVTESSTVALRRFMEDDSNAIQVVSRFNYFMFSPSRICHDSGIKLHVEYSPLLQLWVDIVDDWMQGIMKRDIDTFPQAEQIISKIVEVEAASMFLISHVAENIHNAGIQIIRLLGTFSTHLASSTTANGTKYLAITDWFSSQQAGDFCLSGYEDLLDKSEQSRLEQWRKFRDDSVVLRIVESTNEKDRKLWRYVYPAFLQSCVKYSGPTLGLLREAMIAAVSRYHPSISHLAGLSSRMPAGLNSRNPVERDGFKLVQDNRFLIDQWHIWVKMLCSTAIPPDSSRPALTSIGREHGRAPSDVSFERERYLTTRGLFRHLTPFLDSEYTLFRDAAVLCISSFPANAYPYLLEDLSLLAGRQFYDDPRTKAITTPGLEQNFMTSRQNYDDPRHRNGASAFTERNRRQERLHSAVARIYCITAHLLEQQRSSARQMVLSHILKFVRNTQAFLTTPEGRENHTLHRLRRYFCGIVERLFVGLNLLKDSDRFIPPHIHLTLYRLCEDWCQVGPQTQFAKELIGKMQRAVESAEIHDSRNNLQKFRHESSQLSHASIGALTSLCQKAFFPPEQTANSPTDSTPPDLMQPLTVSAILNRLSAIMTSSNPGNLLKGKNALRALLTHPEVNVELIQEALRGAVVVTDNTSLSSHHFFEVVSDVVCNEHHHFTFSQIVCLGLTNLRHPMLKVRTLAFNMLEAIHQQHNGLLNMSVFEASISSLASATYIHAHGAVSSFLAGEHPFQAVKMLAQLGGWLSQLPGEAYDTNAILLLLQSLESWIPNISLMMDDKQELTREGTSCLYHLTALTLRFGQSHAEQINVLWTKLVEMPNQSNGFAAVKFLIEEAHKVGTTTFISCAANIVASLCQTPIGRKIFEDLCTVITPDHMLPSVNHKIGGHPPPDKQQLWEDLDALFGGEQRLTLGSAQFAFLFLSDVALQRYFEMKDLLPVLLHAIFTHLDHRTPFIRQRASAMLFQILRSWMPGFDELPDRAVARSRSLMKESIVAFEKEGDGLYWDEDESGAKAIPKMKALCTRLQTYFEPLAPNFIYQWGALALHWGTTCSIRATAFRSMQIFRALMPRVKKNEIALLLGRLSNTVASTEENIQAFTSELFLTFNAVANSESLDKALLPQVFWCATACLSTTLESEFEQAVLLVDSLLNRIDLDDPATVDQLLSTRPIEWEGSPFLQPALLRGLRSSATSTVTMKVLQALAQVQDDRLVDDSGGRLRDLYTIALPWCLHAMDNQDTSLKGFAEDISALAAKEKKLSIQKIMNSFAKSHFRTRDDFLRQSVSSLREFGAQHWSHIVTLLLGLVLNKERWLRTHAMQVLKVLFQHRESRPVESLGSELLMPLLRLLETDLAPQALDVLDEPIVMSSVGPAAKHVLRMSMHIGSLSAPTPVPESATVVFGVAQDSGWCVAQPDALRKACQHNIVAVFDTCSVPNRTSRIEFEPEVEALASIKTPLADDLGGLMQNLHELTGFFHKPTPRVNGASIPTRRLEARVAAILAKSTAPDTTTDTPQTPFLDVFTVGGIEEEEDSDEYTDSDSDTDAFMFDSLIPLTPSSTTTSRTVPNGARYH